MRVEKNLETKATQEQMLHWEKLYELYDKQLIPQQELFSNFGLFLKTSSLAKILFLNEIYEHISTIPGDIVEFGSWWGQNLITFENLRAIYEPFNKNRHIIGFDTFSGYRGFSNKDKKGSMVKEGNFSTTKKYYDYLGIEVPDDSSGVLQDIHWSHGSFGYFPTYTIGSFYAAQFFNKASDEIDNIENKILKGDTSELLVWLRNNIHRYGEKYDANELCKKITGEELNFKYFMEYVTKKYSDIYDLN